MSPHRLFRDERGSLPMAMLVVTIGLSLSAMLAPVILRQITDTRNIVDRNTALNGAQIGLDVVMARVRAASATNDKGQLMGQLEDMPGCTITGDAGVDGTGESLRYAVTIVYKDQDGKTMACPLTKVPTTAQVVSEGQRSSAASSDTSGSRSLSATYNFFTSNTNIPGGSIQIASSSVGSLCFDAGSKTATIGTALVARSCSGASNQQFGYTVDLYLKLVNSESTSAPDGLCLHSGATHASGNPITLQKCPTDTRNNLYQWSLDGSSMFHSVSTKSVAENLCINMKSANTNGSAVVMGSCSVSNTLTVWRSSAGVGAGMAGESTSQLVNFAQFSRCLDVTNQNAGYSYMIAWFCKQDPQGKVDWNQIWVHPVPVAPAVKATGPITVTSSDGKNKYCLVTPNSVASNAYVKTTACPANPTPANSPDLMWTVVHNTGVYATSYRIEDKYGNCLQPTDLNASPKDTHSDGTSKVKVEPCSSAELQKWNAPANLTKLSPLTDVREN
ncbi:MAG TPA: RICIN domain-containing protein [Actinoplanes sp.]|nr:RICIN domain-containing protein [Actinoplanes sp.]